MKDFFLLIFTPRFNRFVVFGLILTGIGLILTPIIIGIPILGLGFGLLSVGIMISFAELIPGGKKVITEFGKMFSNMFSFLKNLIKETVR